MENENHCNIMCQDEWEITPLHMAAKQNNVNVLNLLLKRNVDCNTVNSIGRTPLHLAAAMGYRFYKLTQYIYNLTWFLHSSLCLGMFKC